MLYNGVLKGRSVICTFLSYHTIASSAFICLHDYLQDFAMNIGWPLFEGIISTNVFVITCVKGKKKRNKTTCLTSVS